MNEKSLAFLLEYSSPKEIYIVTDKGVLTLLRCPFLVLVKKSIGNLIKHQQASVDEVRITVELITVYVIDSQAYYYFHFEIIY